MSRRTSKKIVRCDGCTINTYLHETEMITLGESDYRVCSGCIKRLKARQDKTNATRK